MLKKNNRTIYLVATVPRGGLIRRIIDRIILVTKVIPPLYRYGADWLIPWAKPCRSPHHASRMMLHHFKKFGKVRYYSLYEKGCIDLKPDDIFIGLPVPDGGFGFDSRPAGDDRKSITSATLRKNRDSNRNKVMIIPFANDHKLMDWSVDLAKNYADKIILIAGDIWTKDWKSTPYGDIDQSRVLRIDNAVDITDYLPIKHSFNPKGERKLLYIGHTGWYKNTAELERIAERMPGFKGTHYGQGIVKGWDNRGYGDFSPKSLEKMAKEHDIFVTVSNADAQATTILENICFGFPIACTPETGYEYPSIVKLDKDDTLANIKALTAMNGMDESDLKRLVEESRSVVRRFHSFDMYLEKLTNFIGL